MKVESLRGKTPAVLLSNLLEAEGAEMKSAIVIYTAGAKRDMNIKATYVPLSEICTMLTLLQAIVIDKLKGLIR